MIGAWVLRMWPTTLSGIAVNQQGKPRSVRGPGQTQESCLELSVVKSWQTSR